MGINYQTNIFKQRNFLIKHERDLANYARTEDIT